MNSTRAFLSGLIILNTSSVLAQPPGPPVSEPVDANVLNFPSVQTVDGTVSVDNFPQILVTPFARECEASSESCSIDLTELTSMGEVHITQASGQAQNVGTTASPRFFNGGFAGPEVLLPSSVNTTDTGNDRDILFSQSMDLIPVTSTILFLEPDSSTVFFYISGYVAGSSAANSATAREAALPVIGSEESP
jgi:hypothetical protein